MEDGDWTGLFVLGTVFLILFSVWLAVRETVPKNDEDEWGMR